MVRSLFLSSSHFNTVWLVLSKVRKTYCLLKIAESKRIEEFYIKSAINKRIESFKLNKSHTIQSILKHPFHKVILDHLVVDDELILEPGLMRSRVDEIMEGWTRKCKMVPNVPDVWHCQYWPLDYIFDEAFSDVIQPIEFLELFGVVSDLPIGKAASLSGISNELETWISMIPKPYKWEGVLTNTQPIALIETACKILSKILSDRILLACSAHDIFRGDNFSVLKSTTTQTSIFAIGSVVEDALEKNRELWLAYDSVGWEHFKNCLVKIKICDKFICFFGNIYRNRTNRIMTDFGLTDDYSVHNRLDQGEESVYGYRLNSHFVSRNGRAESQTGFFTFFAAGAFVDDMIWVDSSQTATQHILNVASEFFRINDISINNDKIVVIPINNRISNPSLFISSSPIFIAKKGDSHQYLGIFLSTDGFSKPSLAKAHSDVRFFSNLVLKKVVSNKQFLYLVSAVLHPIVSYKILFSFVSVSVCDKWNALICKGLKLKSGLSLDFPSDMIHHPFFYGLRSFSQCQSESKVASLISFVNSCGVLGRLFSHRSHNLQVLCWHPIHPLSSPAHIRVCVFNNFLSGLVHILLECNLSLSGSLVSSFWFCNGVSISAVLNEFLFFKYLPSLQHYGIAFVDQLWNHHGDIFDWYTFKWWKKLDPRGPVLEWFRHSVAFFSGVPPSLLALSGGSPVDICGSNDFVSVCDCLSWVGTDSLSVYMDGLVKNLGMTGCKAGAAAFFEDINLGLGVCVQGLMSSTLAELQAIALALECILVDCSVCLFSDCQAVNLLENILHYSNTESENISAEACATYFEELNYNIIRFCEKKYSANAQFAFELESESETSSNKRQKDNRPVHTTPNTPKISFKHLQTPEQETSSKLPLTITLFPASLTQAQTPNSPFNQFTRPKNFTSLRSPTRQQELLQTSSNLLDFLAENQSEHSETAANEKNNSEITEEKSIDSENGEDEITTYIAKIPEFNEEDIETSPQEWLDQVTKAGDANG
ncbi:hypothetical protein G9A89_014870 [Geosiphon pyriformis]|nr:hypothetical protein G9A89_014870 [Geosiphon pyriformis]